MTENATFRETERIRRAVYLVDRPGSDQMTVRVGNLALRGDGPERYAAEVGAQILGGGVDSWLFESLRDQNGYTYDVQ